MDKTTRLGAPIKPVKRSEGIRIRLTEAEHEALSAAAELSSIPISSWCRMILRKAAISELITAGRKSPL